jgi:hypothetical protein
MCEVPDQGGCFCHKVRVGVMPFYLTSCMRILIYSSALWGRGGPAFLDKFEKIKIKVDLFGTCCNYMQYAITSATVGYNKSE